MAEQEDPELTSLMNTSKIHLHVEQLSLKTNQRLVERLFYDQGCKEKSTQSRVGREESSQLRSHPPRRSHRGGEGYQGLGDPPWGVRGLSHMVGTQALGSDTRKTSPLSWFGNQWDLQEGCKKPRLSLRRAHTLVYSWKQGSGSRLTLPRTLAPLSPAQLSARLKAAFAQKSAHWEGTEPARSGTASEWGECGHYWLSQRQWIWSCLEL